MRSARSNFNLHLVVGKTTVQICPVYPETAVKPAGSLLLGSGPLRFFLPTLVGPAGGSHFLSFFLSPSLPGLLFPPAGCCDPACPILFFFGKISFEDLFLREII